MREHLRLLIVTVLGPGRREKLLVSYRSLAHAGPHFDSAVSEHNCPETLVGKCKRCGQPLPTASPVMIPLRPELIEFMSTESLGRFTRCSKTLSTHLREMNAWRLLAAVQCPPRLVWRKHSLIQCPPSTTHVALEEDAISRVRSQVLRRRLAAKLSCSAPYLPRHVINQSTNKFTDFTYFLRLEEDGHLICEIDLHACPSCCESHPSSGGGYLELCVSEPLLARMDSWEGMGEYLSKVPVDDNHDDSFIESLKISIVAVREADSAMIALGCFTFDEAVGTVEEARQPYFFNSQSRLCSLRASAASEFHYKPSLLLELMHDSDGGGHLSRIKLYMAQYRNYSYVDDISVHDFQLLLTHLAGVHHLGREALRMRLLRRARSQAPRLFPGDLERESLAGSDGSRSE